MTKPRVIFLSEIDWDFLWQRHQIFATEYSKNGHVTTYFNKFGMRLPKVSELPYVINRVLQVLFSRKDKPVVDDTSDALEVVGALFIPEQILGSSWLNKHVLIPRFFKKYTGPNEQVIVHLYQPTFLTRDILSYLRARCAKVKVVYDCVQNYDHHPASTEETILLEKELLTTVDVSIADSEFLYQKNRQTRADTIQVPPGVDFDYFHTCYRGDEWQESKKLYFYGHLRQDNDIDLINNLSNAPGTTMTVLGKVDDSVVGKISSNVRVLPPVAYGELCSHLVEADVLVLPYVVNEFTNGIVPAKFMECLATGKPVIATKLPAFDSYRHVLTVVDSSGEYEELNHDVEAQLNLARNASWQSRFNSFYQPLIEEK
ncbi:hypothetical protein ACQKP3_19955 [Vibrio sp. DNB22_10_4]